VVVRCVVYLGTSGLE
jgi:hypothetical protein